MKKWFIYFIAISLVYGASLHFGFFQDDFFHLSISRAHNFSEFLHFFIPQPDKWIFFRPFSTQLYYFIFSSIFSLKFAPLAMHLFMLFLHATNALLVSRISSRIQGITNSQATILGFFYGIWGIHFMSLFYIGATQQLLAMFFTLLTTLFILQKRMFLHLLMLVLALLSKELSIRIPFFLFFYFILLGDSFKQAFKRILPSAVLVVFYLIIRTTMGIITPEQYTFILSPLTTFATLMWYFLLSFGFPEHILHYGLSGGMVDFPKFFQSFSFISALNLVSSFSLTIFSLYAVTKHLLKHFSFIFSLVGIWLSSILPVLFLPTHRYAHYLDLAVIAILILLLSFYSRVYRYLIIGFAIVASLSSVYLDYQTHWSVKRARIASALTSRLQADQACEYSTWNLVGTEYVLQEIDYAVLWDNYLPVICSDHVQLVYNQPAGNYYLLELSESDLFIQ